MTKIQAPSVKGAKLKQEQLERESRLNKREADILKLRRAFMDVSQTAAGLAVLKWFKDQCGWEDSDTVREATTSPDGKNVSYGDILPNTTIHNSAIRTIWTEARKFVPRKALIELEIGKETKKHVAGKKK